MMRKRTTIGGEYDVDYDHIYHGDNNYNDDDDGGGLSPISDMHSPADSVEFLDTNEQESIIKGMERRAQLTNRIYRTCFCTVGIVLSCMFWYFAHEREQFGEAIGSARAQLVHALTAIGFLLVSYRAVTGQRPFFANDSDPIAIPGAVGYGSGDGSGSGIGSSGTSARTIGRSDRPPSVLTAEQVANLFGSGMAVISDSPVPSKSGADDDDQSDAQQSFVYQTTPLSTTTPTGTAAAATTAAATTAAVPPMTPPSSVSSTLSSFFQWGRTPSDLSPRSRVIQEIQKAAEERYGSSRRIDMFFVAAMTISVIGLVMWSGPMMANYQIAVYEGYGRIKLHLFIFSLVLPVFTLAVEYALSLMSTTRAEINDLYGLMYKYKAI